MSPHEEPLRCLAVHALLDRRGEVDGVELEAFLNEIAGPHKWLSTTEWMFVEPPAEVGGWPTVPVVMPEAVAIQAVLRDLTNEPPRILSDRATSPAERRKWRWVTFPVTPNPQGEGRFPWEYLNA